MNMTVIHQRHSFWSRARLSQAVLAIAVLLGCSPMLSSHGYIPDNELVAKLRPGVHDRDSVTSLFGSPTSIANFNGETWLYMKQESKQVAFFDEQTLVQDVLAVHFNKSGVVSDIQRFALADGKVLVLVERKTPTRGKEMTVVEQLFGNIGRFSNKSE
ncbi:MAG: outer membrane protein assembly factor BamE [Proteobacteria bacterium]|nr:outer membrane protein assembly factor BamE [Pseudomonadota bacterium]